VKDSNDSHIASFNLVHNAVVPVYQFAKSGAFETRDGAAHPGKSGQWFRCVIQTEEKTRDTRGRGLKDMIADAI